MSILTRFFNQKRKKRYKADDIVDQEIDLKLNKRIEEIEELCATNNVNKSNFQKFLCGCSISQQASGNIKQPKHSSSQKNEERNDCLIEILTKNESESDAFKTTKPFVIRNEDRKKNKKQKTISRFSTTTDDEENTSEIINNYKPLNIRLYQHRGSHQNTCTGNNDGYPKFLTANNILTDRGCIVNIRTGSFNLGCTANSDAVNNACSKFEENKQEINKELIVPSLNVCGTSDNEEDQEYDDENCDIFEENLSEFNDHSNQIHSHSFNYMLGNNNNLLNANCNEQLDQYRRCSHDPNIEKLHKNYINNVKLLDVPTPTTSIATLTAVTSSLSICKKSSSESSFYNEVNLNTKRLCSDLNNNIELNNDDKKDNSATVARRESLKYNSKSAELLNTDNNERLNEISKVKRMRLKMNKKILKIILKLQIITSLKKTERQRMMKI